MRAQGINCVCAAILVIGQFVLAIPCLGDGNTVQSRTYTVNAGDPPAPLLFDPFDSDQGRRRLVEVKFEYDGEMSMDLTVENFDMQPYAAEEWQVEAYQNALLAFASRDDGYQDGGPFFGLGALSIFGVTGELSAGNGGGPFGDGIPGEVVVNDSITGPVSSNVSYDGELLAYFDHDTEIEATIGPLLDVILSPPPGSFFIDTKVTNVVQTGTVDMTYVYGFTGDTDDSGSVDADDIDRLYANLGNQIAKYDLNGDAFVDNLDVDYLIEHLLSSTYGDSNLDGVFNSSDLVLVFGSGEYEDSVDGNSTWSDGDWNGDGDFTTADLTHAFSQGTYSLGARNVTPVPEPASTSILGLGLGLAASGTTMIRRRRRATSAHASRRRPFNGKAAMSCGDHAPSYLLTKDLTAMKRS